MSNKYVLTDEGREFLDEDRDDELWNFMNGIFAEEWRDDPWKFTKEDLDPSERPEIKFGDFHGARLTGKYTREKMNEWWKEMIDRKFVVKVPMS